MKSPPTPLAINCPRCDQQIQVPATLAGQKAVCPNCQKSFRVPAPGEKPIPEPDASVGRPPEMGLTPGAGAVIPPRMRGDGFPGDKGARFDVPPIPGAPAGVEPGAVPPVTPPTPPGVIVPPKRVARLVVEETIPAALVLTSDGQLPALRLADEEKKEAEQSQSRGVHPLLLLILVCTSVVVSLALIFVDFGPDNSPQSPAKVRARYIIAQEYFADIDDPSPREPYQILLREAQRAYARGDYKREQELYRRVLELLRQERPRNQSVTGSYQRDRRLEELLIVLLSS